MSLSILPMTANDLPAVAELEKLCFSSPWSEAALVAELPKPGAVFLCAHLDGRLGGYVGLNTVLDEGYITNIAVHPDCRRQGVGRALMEALLERGQAMSISFLTLEVRPSNTTAITLYKSLGFAQEGLRKGFYTHPDEDGLIMTYRKEPSAL